MPSTSSPPLRRFLLGIEVGAGTPVGLAGLVVEARIIPQVSLGGGVGVSPGGGVYSVFTVLRPIINTVMPTLRLAYSAGASYSRIQSSSGEFGEYKNEETIDQAQFVQGDLGVEIQPRRGQLVFRFSLGLATLVNPGQLRCDYYGGDALLGHCAPEKVLIPTASVLAAYSF